ncbi:TetR/AcrR family transcriptional regulator [Streptomyces sp. NPDC101234]|uniref:TetR/AcrR family transcriptional regulator n=1 Tax=Streptomyces sp. NPDC101234 TaxID=3366138 RepID=UPI0037F8F44C
MNDIHPSRRRRERGSRERILAAATDLFTTQGINATGMEQLSTVAEVSKRTLYTHFRSKDELVLAYLQALQRDALPVSGAPDEPLLDPREQLLSIFDAMPRDTTVPIRGCQFLNASVEVPDPEHSAHQFAAAYKREFARRLANIARQAGISDAETLGEQLALLYDGVAARGTALNSSDTSACARSIAEVLVDAALAGARPESSRT